MHNISAQVESKTLNLGSGTVAISVACRAKQGTQIPSPLQNSNFVFQKGTTYAYKLAGNLLGKTPGLR
jgi:hypothetical protein